MSPGVASCASPSCTVPAKSPANAVVADGSDGGGAHRGLLGGADYALADAADARRSGGIEGRDLHLTGRLVRVCRVERRVDPRAADHASVGCDRARLRARAASASSQTVTR